MQLRRCFQGCCHFIDSQPVTPEAYQKEVRDTEVLIPCRHIPQEHLHHQVESAVGFYLGQQLRRVYGRLIQTDSTFVYEFKTNEFLRQATPEDVRTWNETWKRLVKEARES